MNFRPLVPFALLLISLASLPSQADGIRRIRHPDGRIEFTNIGTAEKNGRVSQGGSTVYKYRNATGVLSFSDQKPAGQTYEVMHFECYACDPASKVDWRRTPLNLTAYRSLIDEAARRSAVDPALVRALIHAESAFNPKAVSSKGAQGLMQLMPATAAALGVGNALDAAQNIRGGVRHLADLLKAFHGDTRLAVAAYNAGAGAVQKYGGVPPYAETQVYVRRVSILRDRYHRQSAD